MAHFEEGKLVLSVFDDAKSYRIGGEQYAECVIKDPNAPARIWATMQGNYGNTYAAEHGEDYDPTRKIVTAWEEAHRLTGEGGFGDSNFTRVEIIVISRHKVDFVNQTLTEIKEVPAGAAKKF